MAESADQPPQQQQGGIIESRTVGKGEAVSPGTDVRRSRVYSRAVKGTFNTLHRWSGVALMAFFMLLPWIPVGGRQAVLADIPARRLYLFGSIFTPADTFFLVLVGLGTAFGLFFMTTLMGRMWCGFLCPQTVWLEEIIRRFERWIEGPPGRHFKRDGGPWTADKVWRKAVKWGFTLLVSFVLMGTLVGYFAGVKNVFMLRAGSGAMGFVLVMGGALFADLVWFRERFCIFLCPYARFQGALTDDDSLVVGYDGNRGEPRARGRKRPDGAGACIDCNNCVTVCPQGIDIRNGYQMECISCALCVDACVPVMAKFNEPTLVRWETISGARRPRWARPRTVAYAGLLTLIGAAFIWNVVTRHTIEATVNRLKGSLYAVDDEGWTRNTFMVLLTNKEGHLGDPPAPFAIAVEGIDGAELVQPEIAIKPGETRQIPVVVRAPPDAGLSRTTQIRFTVSTDFDHLVVDTTFKSGAPLSRGEG